MVLDWHQRLSSRSWTKWGSASCSPAIPSCAAARGGAATRARYSHDLQLGTLANPAQPISQAVGVADPRMAAHGGGLASRGNYGLLFHGGDGLDELTTTTSSTCGCTRTARSSAWNWTRWRWACQGRASRTGRRRSAGQCGSGARAGRRQAWSDPRRRCTQCRCCLGGVREARHGAA